jgi:hypothetical protein
MSLAAVGPSSVEELTMRRMTDLFLLTVTCTLARILYRQLIVTVCQEKVTVAANAGPPPKNSTPDEKNAPIKMLG